MVPGVTSVFSTGSSTRLVSSGVCTKLKAWLAMSTAVTVMRFRVRVPVLSEQITVTDPRVSTAGSSRIKA